MVTSFWYVFVSDVEISATQDPNMLNMPFSRRSLRRTWSLLPEGKQMPSNVNVLHHLRYPRCPGHGGESAAHVSVGWWMYLWWMTNKYSTMGYHATPHNLLVNVYFGHPPYSWLGVCILLLIGIIQLNKYYGGYISIVGLVYKPSYADQVFQEQDHKQIVHVSGKLLPFAKTPNFDPKF